MSGAEKHSNACHSWANSSGKVYPIVALTWCRWVSTVRRRWQALCNPPAFLNLRRSPLGWAWRGHPWLWIWQNHPLPDKPLSPFISSRENGLVCLGKKKKKHLILDWCCPVELQTKILQQKAFANSTFSLSFGGWKMPHSKLFLCQATQSKHYDSFCWQFCLSPLAPALNDFPMSYPPCCWN